MSESIFKPNGDSSLSSSFQNWPIFQEGFRTFFPLAALFALLYVVYWGISLSAGIEVAGLVDPVLLHQYDMIFGYLMAAMAGFLTTAVPAWSGTPKVQGRELFGLTCLWLFGRLAFWFIDNLPAWLVFGSHLLFMFFLILRLAKPILSVRMRHLIWPVLLLGCAQMIASIGYIFGEIPLSKTLSLTFETGVILAEGSFMVMILVALSAISTAIVNLTLTDNGEKDIKFLPRPPVRRVAITCVSLFTTARILPTSEALQGWLALASACAVLAILQDWHIRKALSSIYTKGLYATYWLMTAGLALQAAGLLGIADYAAVINGRHAIYIGSFSFTTLMVLIIAGSRHSGHQLIFRPLFALAMGFMIAACFLRAIAPLFWDEIDWMVAAWMCFALSYGCYLVQFVPWAFSRSS
ncbi:uncharacterized protein involved in response to NO [Cohaesibacter marisflavi]|uniref:Uncharacterized protein involved in response to NO n=1 Tax=Cohaesibacter marisflavi TaxID=655353 RepID=A0A1I5M8R6_9HYPH|nr:NnrS family protein [Cohaesibacter marisflavi]SFP06028.1 uncharacterized protein involved in response to NO [Cohaesibacter marisflavi]